MGNIVKYRGISKETHKWVFGYFYTIQNKEHYILEPCVFGLLHTEVIPETVGMFTDETDKDGKEIYTNDIFKDVLCSQKKGIVKFGEYINCFDKIEINFGGHVGFYVDFPQKSIRKDLKYWAKHSTIIGNKFDNPELL